MDLVVVAAAWLLSLAAVSLWDAPGWFGAATIALASPMVAVRFGRRGLALAVAAALLALVAGLRHEAWLEREAPPLAGYVGQEVTVEGVVTSESDPGRTTTRYRVDVERLDDGVGWRPMEGAVLITVGQYEEFGLGDRLRLRAELKEPPVFEEFDYRGYLRRQGIVATALYPRVLAFEPGGWTVERELASVRLALEDGLQRSLPEPAASLGAGIAFGRDEGLPKALYDDFRTTGLAHIVAVSGSNVALVTGVVFLVAVRFVRRQWAIVPAATTLVAYVAVAGFSASVVRAGLMAVIFLIGMALGRQQSALAALGGAAILMTLQDPGTAQDLGFQLSLAATAGLITFGPWLRFAIRRATRTTGVEPYVPELVVQATALSIAATIATLPIVWVNFGRVSLVGPLANILVEPLFFVAFWLAIATAILGWWWAPAGWAAGVVAYYPLAFIVGVAETLARLPLAAVDVPRADGQWALVAYLVLGAVAWPAYRYLAPHEPRLEPPETWKRTALAGATGCLVAIAIPVSLLPLRGPGELRVDLLDVGQGDAILLTTPGGQRLLVDGGPSGIELARELGAVLPHWEREIDLVILSHPQLDHVGGLPELVRRYEVERTMDAGTPHRSAVYGTYAAEAPARVRVAAGDAWELDGVLFEVLWPPPGYAPRDTNDASLVLRVEYRGTKLLLTGDIEAGVQAELVASGADIEAEVLKVPHHGAKSSAGAFLQAVGADVALISVGAANRYGHPHEETLLALAASRVYRTDEHGRVTLWLDGSRIRVATER